MDENLARIIFRTYGKRLYNTALRITLSTDEAEEIMQESLIRYLKAKNAPTAEVPVWVWLRTTCVRLSLDWLKRKKKFTIIEAVDFAEEEVEEPLQDDGGRMLHLIMEKIQGLPDGYRAVLLLKLIEEMEYAEIAAAMGISEAGVRSQYMRGRQKLMAELRAAGINR